MILDIARNIDTAALSPSDDINDVKIAAIAVIAAIISTTEPVIVSNSTTAAIRPSTLLISVFMDSTAPTIRANIIATVNTATANCVINPISDIILSARVKETITPTRMVIAAVMLSIVMEALAMFSEMSPHIKNVADSAPINSISIPNPITRDAV